MASFDIQSGNINYAFSFQSNTGEAPWELTFSYANTEESLFASPIVNQIITGIAGTGNSVWANQYNLAIGSSSSGQVNTYINEGIISPVNENIYQQNNLITGNGPTGLSGLGYSISATDDMFVIGSPFATVNGASGVGGVQVFRSFGSGGAGVTGTGSYEFVGALTGTQQSGNFGKFLATTMAQSNDFLSVGAPGENNQSGSLHIYEVNSLDFIQSITPTGDNVSNFGKSSAWFNADGLEFVGVGYDQGGSGKLDVYKQDSDLNNVFYYFQTVEPYRGAHSGDMFAYSMDEGDENLFVGGPKIGNSGAVFEYAYNTEEAVLELSQDIFDTDGASGDNFGKNLSFGDVNGVITSNKNSGEGYIYEKSGVLWSKVSTVSGSENAISGSFGGDLHGSHVTQFYGENLIIGSSQEPYTYIYNTGAPLTQQDSKFSISGSGGKLFDSEGNFIYGYSASQTNTISGNVFTGGNHNIFVNNILCVSSSPRETGAINNAAVTNPSNLNHYTLRVFGS
jgi:hypothetical protein